MGRRTLLLVAALVVAALGTSLVFLYVSGADARAAQGLRLVTGLVAKSRIPAGTTGRQAQQRGWFDQRKFTVESVPPGQLVANPADIADLVARVDLIPGQMVLRSAFSAAPAPALPIPKGKMAVSVQLSDAARVGNFLRAGSKVAVYVTTTSSEAGGAVGGEGATASASPPAARQGGSTALLLPEADVIAVDGVTTDAGPSSAPTRPANALGAGTAQAGEPGLVTLGLNEKQASKVIFAQEQGELYLALLEGGAAPTASAPVGLDNLFD